MTCREILSEQTTRLKAAGIPEPEADAFLLFEKAFSMSRMQLLMDGRRTAPEKETAVYLAMIDRRLKRIPVQQILGSANFCGYDFYVNENVLTPRQDTEVLAELALNQMIADRKACQTVDKAALETVDKAAPKPVDMTCAKPVDMTGAGIDIKTHGKTYRILDMCTGSGCIGLTMYLFAKERGIDVSVTCVDLSEKALEVAGRNNEALCEGKVKLVKSDLFTGLSEEDGPFDLLLSNPPYIRSDVIDGLMPEVKDHEPRMALDGTEDGLYFYRKIARQAGKWMKQGSHVFLEIGYDQGEEVKTLFSQNGFSGAEVHKDLAGLDRVVSAVYTQPH